MVAYIVTLLAIFGAANLLSYLLRRNNKQFRLIVLLISILASPIAAYFLVK